MNTAVLLALPAASVHFALGYAYRRPCDLPVLIGNTEDLWLGGSRPFGHLVPRKTNSYFKK